MTAVRAGLNTGGGAARREPDKTGAGIHAPAPPSPPAGAFAPDTLECLLWAHLARRPAVATREPRLHLISLGEIKAALGEAWPRLAPRAVAVAETVLRNRLADGDHFCRHGDEAFLLSLGDADPAEAEERVSTIVTDLRRILLGRKADDGAIVVHCAALTLAQLLGGGTIPMSSAVKAHASDAGDGLTPNELAARLHRQISFVYAPVWSPRSQRVEGHICLARRQADYGTFHGTWALNGGYEDPFALGIDMRMVDAALADLRRLIATGDEVPLFVLPLHYRSLCGERGVRLLEKLEDGVAEEERRHLVLEITGARPTMPLGSLPPLIATLKGLGKAVFVRAVHGALTELAPWLDQADAVGIDLGDLSRQGADPHARARALRDFFKVMDQPFLPKARYLWDARSTEEALLAMTLGAALLSGPAGGGAPSPRASSPLYLGRRHLGLEG